MEFNFIIGKCIALDEQGIGVYEAASSRINKAGQLTENEKNLSILINKMGELSAIAQSLKQVITQYDIMRREGQKLYIIAEGRQCQGILKIGTKNLFYRDATGSVKEIKPLCVLDFYVHESCQRQGYGKILFEEVMRKEGLSPEMFAYDRPSPKLIGFLRKHYGLSRYVAQNNNFVVFDAYFSKGVPANANKSTQNKKDYFSERNNSAGSLAFGNTRGIAVNNNLFPPRPVDIQQSKHQNELANAGRAILSLDEQLKAEKRSLMEKTPARYPPFDRSGHIEQQQQLLQQSTRKNDPVSVEPRSKHPLLSHDIKIDQIQQRILETEKEINLVDQQILKQKNNIQSNQAPLVGQQQQLQKPQQTFSNTSSSPWANSGFNYYQTSSSNYGKHQTFYK